MSTANINPTMGGGTFTTDADGSIRVSLLDPQDCGKCRHSAYVFVNRNGRTVCVACDKSEYPDPAPAAPVAPLRSHHHDAQTREVLAAAERETEYDRTVRQTLPWPEDSTPYEASTWCLQQWGHLAVLFGAACTNRNAGKLKAVCSDMRRIVTRMDAFRRMKERQWAGVEKHKPTRKDRTK